MQFRRQNTVLKTLRKVSTSNLLKEAFHSSNGLQIVSCNVNVDTSILVLMLDFFVTRFGHQLESSRNHVEDEETESCMF